MTPEQHDQMAGLFAGFSATGVDLRLDEDGVTVELDRLGITVGVYPSSGVDGAWVVAIDTVFEPDGSGGQDALRVYLNDADLYIGRPLKHRGDV